MEHFALFAGSQERLFDASKMQANSYFVRPFFWNILLLFAYIVSHTIVLYFSSTADELFNIRRQVALEKCINHLKIE